ncbi:MAG: hypothetical protein C4557_07540 [Anaerolineaceae bacterium]|jgi:hypothetical protein|nr:MAG: hypothetical protein C4557_07540 [Anaerolineaceae bacterium]
MKKQPYPFRQLLGRFIIILIIVTLIISCQASAATEIEESAGATLMEPRESPEAAPPELPATFQTSLLNPLDTPHTYVEETCRYLRNKWHPSNAEPGTVVMIIQVENINRGMTDQPGSIRVKEFTRFMEQLKAQGFEAITMKQFQAFMERNIKIPPRSALIIQDDNHDEEYLSKNYRKYWEDWGWTFVNGWVSDPEVPQTLVQENLELEREGFIDHQAQGVFPDTKLTNETAKNVIARELQGSLDGFAGHFAKNPVAIIWPNGGFGIRPVEAARQLRFKLGFTENPRGPVMYNWVPLADVIDPNRPDYAPEGIINDPLMTLPRYSSGQVFDSIDIVRAIGKEAAAYAQSNKEIEHRYYEIVCSETYGPMPTP